ncbi:MAG: ionic transporter y4hA [Burkholderiales bacterium]|nr:ionic transporter y4hA [Burkholderiales bacterium]
MPLWTVIVPVVSLPLAGLALAWPPGGALAAVCAIALCASVVASVHHAEVVAHRVGEPFGTLILAVAVTVIEVALIVSVMLTGGESASGLARDTIFSAIMITCNGAVGLCVIAGGLKHHEQSFRLEGATSALAALIVLATLSLVLPAFTTTVPGPDLFSTSQLAFAAFASLALWAVFVFVQTVRHRDYFLPPDRPGDEAAHAAPPSTGLAWASFGLLIVALLAVIGLAKTLSPTMERGIASAGLPPTVIGIVIAMLVLAPETWAALRAARADRLQTSLNLALGSALASIGLTIPAVAMLSIALDRPLRLGLAPKDLVLLVLTFVVATITLGTGRTNVLQGAVHLLIFAAFLFLAIVP